MKAILSTISLKRQIIAPQGVKFNKQFSHTVCEAIFLKYEIFLTSLHDFKIFRGQQKIYNSCLQMSNTDHV